MADKVFWTRVRAKPDSDLEYERAARLCRCYGTLKQAQRHAAAGLPWNMADGEWDIVEYDPDMLQPSEMTDDEAYTYHEKMMLWHSERAQEAKKRMGV